MLASVMKFVVPFVVCCACLAVPVDALPGIGEYFCEEEAKQVLMAFGVTVVMLFHKQLFPKQGQSSIPDHQASATSPAACW